jgi:hypothetical protein
MTRHNARWLRFSLMLAWAFAMLCFAPRSAHAWVEWHHIGENVTIDLNGKAMATVEHSVRYRVHMGPLRTVDVPGVEARAEVMPEGEGKSDDGQTFPLRAELLPLNPKESALVRTARLNVQETKGLKRGVYTFTFRYSFDASHLFERDGVFAKMTFRGSPAPEGYDNGTLLLRVPHEATAPAALPEQTVQSSLALLPGVDELRLVRAHVAKGEVPVWNARISPRAFTLKEAHPAFAPPPAPEPKRSRLFWLCATLVALAFGLVFLSLLSARGGYALLQRPSVARLRPFLGGALASAVVALDIGGYGTVAVATSGVLMLVCVNRNVRTGSGWLPIRAELLEAQRPWDGTTRWGAMLFVVLTAAFLLAGYAARSLRADTLMVSATLVAALLCAFYTGTIGTKLRTMRTLLRSASHDWRPTLIGAMTGGRLVDCGLSLHSRNAIPGVLAVDVSCPAGFRVEIRTVTDSPAARRLRRFAPHSITRAAEGQRVYCTEEVSGPDCAERVAQCVDLLKERRSSTSTRSASTARRRDADYARL